jgi:hypothetical protein
MKQHTPMVNPNYLSKCPIIHSEVFHSNTNMQLIAMIEYKVVALLILKEMEIHLNPW